METKLEKLGDEFRKENIIKNEYQQEKPYKDTHQNALSDGDNKGKGTGGSTESLNTTSGGGDMDINGNPEVPGSGRIALVAKNTAKYDANEGPNGYGPTLPYYPGYIIGATS